MINSSTASSLNPLPERLAFSIAASLILARTASMTSARPCLRPSWGRSPPPPMPARRRPQWRLAQSRPRPHRGRRVTRATPASPNTRRHTNGVGSRVETAMIPSPVCLINLPKCESIVSSTTWSWLARACLIASGCASHRRVEPSTSVKRNVTVPTAEKLVPHRPRH